MIQVAIVCICLWHSAHGFARIGGFGRGADAVDVGEGAGIYDPQLRAAVEMDVIEGDTANILQQSQGGPTGGASGGAPSGGPDGAPGGGPGGAPGGGLGGGRRKGGFDFMRMIGGFMGNGGGGQGGGGRMAGLAQMLQGFFNRGGTGSVQGGPPGGAPAGQTGAASVGRRGPPPEISRFISQFIGGRGHGGAAAGGV